MRKYLYMLAACALCLCAFTACMGDDDEPTDDWKLRNDEWIIRMEAQTLPGGDLAYQRINCPWDPQAYVLMRWHNDRALTQSRLSPLYTSTVDVKYQVMNIDSVMLDNSYKRTAPADSVFRTQLSKTITGWAIGISQMHVGDSCTILIPYNQAYGQQQYLNVKGCSNLIFDVKLTGIPGYEKKP